MKKTYISPSTIAVRVETTVMNNNSFGVYSTEVTDEKDLLSRGRNRDLWDDEDE